MTITQAEANQWVAQESQRVAGYLGFDAGAVPQATVHVIPANQWDAFVEQQGGGSNGGGSMTVGDNIYLPSSAEARDAQGRIAYELVHVQTEIGNGDTQNAQGQLVGDHKTLLGEAQAQAIRVKMGFAPLSSLQGAALNFYRLNPTQMQEATQRLAVAPAEGFALFDKDGKLIQGQGQGQGGTTPNPITDPIGYFFGQSAGATGPSGSVTLTLPPPTSTGPKDAQARLHAWENLTNQWNIKQDPAITKLMEQGNKAGWTEQTFLWHLRQTQEYHDAFPYIQGTGMSEAAYVAQTKAYQTAAASYGVNLTPALQSMLFQRGISSTTASQRFQAESQLRTNQPLFDAFNRQRKADGKPILSRQDMMSFILGEGNQSWYDDWNNANSRYAGNMAGVTFDNKAQEYTSVGKNVVKEVAGLGLTQDAERSGYQKLAQQLKTSLPLSRIQKFGLTKQDLVELEFGGKRQASVAATVQSILANESNLEDQSNKVLGIGGIQPGKNNQGSQQALAQE